MKWHRTNRKPKINRNWPSPLRLLNFVLAFALIGTLLLYFTKAAPTPGLYGSIEKHQVDMINGTRAQSGIAGVQHIECLNAVAEQWTQTMASQGYISHNPSLGNMVSYACGTSWNRITENVGVGYESSELFNAFMTSSGHKANILDKAVTKTGVGAYHGSDGRLWVTQVFARCTSCGGAWATAASLPSDPVAPASVTGNVDVANCRRIAGWAFDKNKSASSIPVHIYVDGVGYNTGNTAVSRPDVNSAYGISGTHGFDWVVPDTWRDGKTHTAQIYGLSVSGTPNVLIAQRTLDACASPIGVVDAASCSAVSGWAFDMNDVARSIDVHIYIDGVGYNTGPTKVSRPDVNSAYGAYGVTGTHGFSYPTPSRWKDGRQHQAAAYGINVGAGGNSYLGSRTFGPCY